MTRFHIACETDTVQSVAKAYGVSPEVLRRINDLGGGSRLALGQRLYLNEQDVLGVRVLILDVDRNPIQGVAYLLEFCGRVTRGTTGEDGLTKQIFTERPRDEVRILIARLDGSIKYVTTVVSGSRNKLVTILTPRYRADGRTELDVGVKPGQAPQVSVTRKPIYQAHQRKPTTGREKLGPEASTSATAEKRPLIKVIGDIPDLDLFLDQYDGRVIGEADYREAAAELKCEPGLIYAIARQESAKSSFFKIGARTVPTILFERHWFKILTMPNPTAVSPYEAKYPDICGSSYRRAKRVRNKGLFDANTGSPVLEEDTYGGAGLPQYKRLVKAYQLDPDAALQSCSWGKFQLMGTNYKDAGFDSVRAFARAMSRNEVEHLKALLRFARRKPLLLAGLREANFEKIAAGHNGGLWRKVNPEYAENLRRFYDVYTKSSRENT